MNPLHYLPDTALDLPRLGDYLAIPSDDADALLTDRERLDYAELRHAVSRTAGALADLGVRQGDCVAILAAPGPDFWVSFLAVVRLGAIWLGLSPRNTPTELAMLIEDARPVLILVAHGCDAAALPDNARAIPMRSISGGEELADQSDPDAPALIVFTSGSSGRRKGALISQRALIAGARRRIAAWGHGPFRTLMNLPINHIGGVGDLAVTTLISGGCLSIMPKFDAAATLSRITRDRLTFWYQVPTMFELVLAADDPHSHDLSSLRAVCWSGAPASEALVSRLEALFPGCLGTDYSQTESVGAITLAPLSTRSADLIGSPGWPDPSREVRLSDDGEVLVAAKNGFLGYLGQSDATAETLVGNWLHTGDIGEWLSDGRLRLVGRKSDMYKSGGYNVYPREIEALLEAEPTVARAAVVGIPDPVWGEVGHVWIEPAAGADVDLAALKAALTDRLAHYKRPKAYHLLDALPLLLVGKVDKRALAAMTRE